jgi:mono/diheme cytochrome c family protein
VRQISAYRRVSRVGRCRPLAVALFAACLIGLGLVCFPGAAVESQQGGPTSPAPAPTSMSSGSWILLPPMSPSATQADVGKEIYRLVCSACHAADGKGLTAAWLATWAPQDQNCWQSKCHAPNHPPDGFDLPRYVPPVVGPLFASRYRTALDVYQFIRQTMPYQAPGSLQDNEYWELTAFLARMNGVDPGQVPLDRGRAAEFLLQPEPGGETAVIATETVTASPVTPVESQPASPTPARLSSATQLPSTPEAQPAAAGASFGKRLPLWSLLAIAGICVAVVIVLFRERSLRRH